MLRLRTKATSVYFSQIRHFPKLAQNEIGDWGRDLAPNPLEGGRLPFKPKITVTYGKGGTPNRVKHHERIRKATKAKRTQFFRPAHFLWLPIAASLAVAAGHVGAPHLRWSYSYETFAGRTQYNRCEYVGFNGVTTVRPSNGHCPIIAFL